ncbi:SLAP domain-containing protein [Lactobacillus intestinalis]|uniref:SLAP domain-containing protein n=1 Tax=Lactobacillus intestinalis TaxID=151781 RepID=UPI00243247A4|nr:SLAP domain-containing protein [Lactobacillus intestinalis]
MKKNLRIVSAAAAALLAVAPIAASSVTANAAVVPNEQFATSGSATPAPQGNILTFSSSLNNVNASEKVSDLTSDANVLKVLSVTSNYGADKPQIVGVSKAVISDSANGGTIQDSLKAGKKYYLQAWVTVSGLQKSKKYKSTNAKFGASNSDSATTTNQGTVTNVKIAIEFNAVDPNAKGNPYVSYNTSVNNTPSWETLSDKQTAFSKNAPATVGAMVDEINGKFKVAPNSVTTPVAFVTNADDVIQQLTAAGIKVNGTGANATFTIPDKGFDFKVTSYNSTNGKSAVAYAHFKSSVDNSLNYPLIRYRKNSSSDYFNVQQGSNNFNNAMQIVTVKMNTNDWAETIVNHFKATQAGKMDGNNVVPEGAALRLVSSDLSASGFNANVAGLYPMTLEAKNSDGLTTTLHFNVAVTGSTLDEIKNVTVHSNGQVKLVSMVANTTSDLNGVIVNNGQSIAVYPNDTKTVNGVEYTRVARTNVDREQNNQWIETKYIKEETKTEKTVMHDAAIYNKDGQNTHATSLKRYNKVTVLGDKVSINGASYYKIGDNQYIKASNIDGTEKTLKHNAYVYATSKKRANKDVLKKGTKVTVYGGSYKFKNGKRYYKIGNDTKKTYVKVANFE